MKPNSNFSNPLTLPEKKSFGATVAGHSQPHLSQENDATPSSVNIEPNDAFDAVRDAVTTEELIIRAKRYIAIGETSRTTSFRAAAEDIARAHDQGATQRKIADGVGKSAAWVNRLLQWLKDGCVGAPFGDKVVQGVNKNDLSSVEPVSVSKTSEAHGLGDLSVRAQTTVAESNDIAAAMAQGKTAAKKLSGSERARLINTLEFLATERPRLRAQFALNVEKHRAELGLTWDELLITAEEQTSSAALDTEHVEQGTDDDDDEDLSS